jgi:hypothetical protein
MDKIKKNDLAGQNISQQSGIKMRRREKPDADVKLILIPCLCDFNETRAWANAAHAGTASKTPR